MSFKKDPNRILLILPDAAIGGGHAMNLRLADQLTRRGWIVDIAFLFDRHDASVYRESYPNLKQISMCTDGRISRILLPLHLARLARRYHLILAGMDLAATNYGYLAALLARKPFVSWVHTAFNEHSRSISRVGKIASLWIYRRLSHIVFPSRGSMESLSRALGGRPKNAHWEIIENFLADETDVSKTSENPSVPFPELILPIVLSIGRLAESKAYDRLVRVHALLRQRGVMHCLVILGEGPERQRLSALAKQLGVADTFFLPGHVSNPRGWLAISSIFALCSHYEGMPLVLIEALQSGIPIASMDCPAGPREILDGGDSGLLVPPGDEIALADAIARLLSDPVLCSILIERGKKKARHYEPTVIIPRWEKLLGSMIGYSPRKP